MRLLRKLYRKLFFRIELNYSIRWNVWSFFYKSFSRFKPIGIFYNTKDLANAIEDWKNGK